MTKKVLIVEDQLIIARTNAMLLEREGFEVRIETSIQQALTTLNLFNPDIVLMDIQFKEDKLGGINTAREIRKKSNIPIIFVSGSSHKQHQDSLKDISNSFFISKPIRFEELHETIKHMVHQTQDY